MVIWSISIGGDYYQASLPVGLLVGLALGLPLEINLASGLLLEISIKFTVQN